MSESRQLAAIVFSDISGFTHTMEGDENRAMAQIQKHREIVTNVIQEFNGEMLKEMGDGILLKFTSAIEAVRCANQIQTHTETENFNLKIGIHLGDVIIKDNDIFGSGVNIASRIHEHGSPGSICISNEIWLQIKNQTDINANSLGKKKLKGVDGKIEIYQLGVEGGQIKPAVQKQKLSIVKKIVFPVTGLILTILGGLFWFIYPFISIGMSHERDYDASIAILYMENMSSEENSYFADGLTEELINRLSRIQNLKVRPRTDVAVYKDKTLSLGDIAEELSVNYIVEGSVRISGNKLRVNVQLFDIAQDNTVWSDSYNNKLKDIFSVQDEIASSIVSKLNEKLSISKTDIIATEKRPTESLEAYKLIQEADKILSDTKLSRVKTCSMAIPLIEQALKLDSTYTDALCNKALCKFIIYDDNEDPSNQEIEDVKEAIILVEKGLLYDPNHETALALSIMIPTFQMRHNKDEFDLFSLRKLTIQMERLIEKFPDSPFTISMSGFYYLIRYRFTENKKDAQFALDQLLKSHSIIKNNMPLIENSQNYAKELNFKCIPLAFFILSRDDDAFEFLQSNKNMMCPDGTLTCLSSNSLRELEGIFYNNYYYETALEIIQLTINKSTQELDDEGFSLDLKAFEYYRAGMIYMKWGEYDKAINNFEECLEIAKVLERDNVTFDEELLMHRIGLNHYYNGNMKVANEILLEGIEIWNINNINTENIRWNGLEQLNVLCGLTSLMNGNIEKAKTTISKVESQLDDMEIKFEQKDEYFIYYYLYLYYNELNQSSKAFKNLETAYNNIDKKQIDQYNNHLEKDTHPRFFYCRDIITAYESNLNQ